MRLARPPTLMRLASYKGGWQRGSQQGKRKALIASFLNLISLVVHTATRIRTHNMKRFAYCGPFPEPLIQACQGALYVASVLPQPTTLISIIQTNPEAVK